MKLYKRMERGLNKEIARKYYLSASCNPDTHEPVIFRITLSGSEYIPSKGHSRERYYELELSPEDMADLEGWAKRLRERRPPERFGRPAKR